MEPVYILSLLHNPSVSNGKNMERRQIGKGRTDKEIMWKLKEVECMKRKKDG